jgi:DNA-binding NarL/FixJ family response regulator
VDIIVAALEAQVRAALQARLSALGLEAAEEVDSPAALARGAADLAEPAAVSGVRWPETAPFLDCAQKQRLPLVLLLEEDLLDAGHEAFRRGATALLPWPPASAVLAQALEAVRHGLRLVPDQERVPGIRAAMASPSSTVSPSSALSPRERELLELVAVGLGNKAIARALGVSVNTVKYHLGSIFVKLDARTRAEAVSAAARRGELLL